ncbi:MAG TPA: exodeoxyribonuclease VII small subunit [Clostridiaceae bacterium]
MVKKAETYETQLEMLEKIVEKMDSGEVSLADSMKDYEEGVKLCNKLYKTLNEAEGKIKIISGNSEEEFSIKQ